MTMTMQGHKPYRRPNINENYAQLTGTAIHMFRVPGTETVVLTLATSGGGNRSNYPKVTWYGELANEVEETVSIGDRVSVIATVQTKRFERKGERPIYRQNLVGNGITPALKKIESTFGLDVDQGEYVDDANEIRLGGTALHIFKVPDRDIVIITIRTFTNGHVNMPKVTLFGRSAEYALENISEGDAICAIGYAYTNRAEKSDGSREYYEGITCNSIALAPSEEETMGG